MSRHWLEESEQCKALIILKISEVEVRLVECLDLEVFQNLMYKSYVDVKWSYLSIGEAFIDSK